jgi:hypothetical protein
MSVWDTSARMMVAGRDFHHDNVASLLTLIDLPVLIPAALLLWPLDRVLDPMAASYVVATIWLLMGSAWWFFLGRVILKAAKRRSKSATPTA